MKFLSYESPFSQILLKLCYSCYLNLLWFICCIPIFTVGASTTALYYTTLKIVRDEEETSVARMFFRSFRENFRQSTVLWLILFAVGAVLGADGYILYHLRATSAGTLAVVWTLCLALVIGAAVLYCIVLIYVFPLVASVSNTNGAMLKNSFLIGTHYLFCTIVVFAIHFAVFFVVVAFFTPLMIFGEGLCALLSSYLLSRVIQACSYDPNQPETAGQDDGDASDDEDGV